MQGCLFSASCLKGDTKNVLIKVDGASLKNAGISGVLLDPVLTLYSGQNVITSNDDWKDGRYSSDISNMGMSPSDSREPAIIATLSPGAYIAIVSGYQNSTGVALVSVNDIGGNGVLSNISTRGLVGNNANVMIAGFIIEGDTNIWYSEERHLKTVLIRGDGSSLLEHGVTGILSDPTLQLYAGQTMIKSNDNWISDKDAILSTGMQPSNSSEPAMLSTFNIRGNPSNPGAYAVIVRGKNSTSGVALVSVTSMD